MALVSAHIVKIMQTNEWRANNNLSKHNRRSSESVCLFISFSEREHGGVSAARRYSSTRSDFFRRALVPRGASDFAGLSSLKDWRSPFLAPPTAHGGFAQNPSLLKGANPLIQCDVETLLWDYWLRVCAVIYCGGDIAFTPAIIHGFLESCTHVLSLSLTSRNITLHIEITPNDYCACYYTGIILTGNSWAPKAIEM